MTPDGSSQTSLRTEEQDGYSTGLHSRVTEIALNRPSHDGSANAVTPSAQ